MKIAIAAIIDLSHSHWGPPLAAEGLPGTEEAILHMAQGLARLGHEVHVLTNCGQYAGIWEGVRWIDLPAGSAVTERYDIAVVTGLELLQRIDAARRYVWLHVHLGEDELLEAQGSFDKVMPLSAFSRQQYPRLPEQRVFLTRNGIVPRHFDRPATRHPHRLVYGSDYDRGLLLILRLWPQIRRAVPDATLHVFYGWQVLDKKLEAYRETDPVAFGEWTKLRNILEQELRQDGVTHLGRIGHEAVAQQYLEAGVWAYPCLFPESSCITAMKAQAAGAIPVVIPTAALRETVRWGLRTQRTPPDYRNLDRELAYEWLNGCIAILLDVAYQERTRPPMMADARAFFDWRTVASEWVAEFEASSGG